MPEWRLTTLRRNYRRKLTLIKKCLLQAHCEWLFLAGFIENGRLAERPFASG
jgi:hypothetical protein